MPQLGLGTSHQGGYSEEAIRHALLVGCRHVDTAQRYGSEEGVGKAVMESGLDRGELFITTKLWPDYYGNKACMEATSLSLSKLNMDYVDLYLLHWPGARNSQELLETWRTMELLLESGKARAIGVSNFQERHLLRLLEDASIAPHVNQIEFHPYQQDLELINFCKERNICVGGYSPLAKGRVVDDPVVKQVAKEKGVTAAQVVIRWSLQREIITIPKSTKVDRVTENFNVLEFALNLEQMSMLDSLDRDMRVTWDPSTVP
eukprot:TRINITY_DN3885_c0_g1_i1.p1 TRINITY_DN3885_c0_g1~~TRINITY_DN3885_c0_g1_i1.p1  ORF type:complete len:286 (-),score=89.24 TRINITY_DN3885_c0_g1_i1:442-1224(-)